MPKVDETWECPRCGAFNHESDFECQWCDPPEQLEEEWQADHKIDQRKHER